MDTPAHAADILLKPRVDRAKLNPANSYTRVQKLQGKEVSSYMGQFVKAYMTGFGDGAMLHMEFLRRGETLHISEELWGPMDGEGMSYFFET